MKEIRKAYKKSKEQCEKIRFSQVRKIFRKYKFQSLLYQIDEFEMRFNKIVRKVRNGKKEKNKKEKN